MARRLGRKPTIALFAIASAMAALATLSVAAKTLGDYQKRLAASIPKEPERIEVLRAVREIPPGTTLVADDLVVAKMEPEYVFIEALTRLDEAVGRVTRERVLLGDMLREERLASAESGAGLNALVSPGMRAMSFNVSGGEQVSGFLIPNNRVDVLATLFDDDGTPAETRTVLQDVRVLAVDDRTLASREKGAKLKPQVTIALPPNEAERVTHAFEVGRVRFTLRSDLDLQFEPSRSVTTEQLLGHASGKAFTIDQWYTMQGLDRPQLVRIIHGQEVVVEQAAP